MGHLLGVRQGNGGGRDAQRLRERRLCCMRCRRLAGHQRALHHTCSGQQCRISQKNHMQGQHQSYTRHLCHVAAAFSVKDDKVQG